MSTPKITICWKAILLIISFVLFFGILLPLFIMLWSALIIKSYLGGGNAKVVRKAKFIIPFLRLYSMHNKYAQLKDSMNLIIATVAYREKDFDGFLNDINKISSKMQITTRDFWLAIYYFDIGETQKALQFSEQHSNCCEIDLQRYILQGIIAYQNGDVAEAKASYSSLRGEMNNPILIEITDRLFNFDGCC